MRRPGEVRAYSSGLIYKTCVEGTTQKSGLIQSVFFVLYFSENRTSRLKDVVKARFVAVNVLNVS